MHLVGNFEYLGTQEIQGKKDPSKTYYNVLLMQGSDVVKVFVNDETVRMFTGISKLDPVQCVLDVNVGGQKTYLNILQVQKVKQSA